MNILDALDIDRLPNPEESLKRIHDKAHNLIGFSPETCQGLDSYKFQSQIDLLKLKLDKTIREYKQAKAEIEFWQKRCQEYEQRRIKVHKAIEGKI